MNAKTRDKWVKALRSGKYEQMQASLGFRPAKNRPARYCCLGVLASLESKKLGAGWDVVGSKGEALSVPTQNNLSFTGHLPITACQLLALDDMVMRELATANDSGQSFDEIADLIEQRVEVTS